MYPDELARFIAERGYELQGEDLIKASSVDENPQLNHIKFNPWDNTFDMWDQYGNYYHFKALPYNFQEEESKKLQLTKK